MASDSVSVPISSIAIVVAALILSASIFVVGGSINSNLVELKTAFVSLPSSGGTIAPSNNQPIQAPTQVPTQNPPSNDNGGSVQVATEKLLNAPAGVKGDPNAKVVIVEYSDYQCPFCGRFYADSESKIISKYVDSGKVLLLYKDFPLSFHPFAEPAAEGARCAGEQGKYWEMHEKIFTEVNKANAQGITPTAVDLKAWAKTLGLDSTKFDSCLDSGKTKAAVQANFQEGSSFGVSGTPTFFIGKVGGTAEQVVGAQPYAVFEQALDNALK